MNNNDNIKSIKFSTFLITTISIIIVFIISLIGIIFYYEHKMSNQVTDLTLIPNVYNDDMNLLDSEENLIVVE